MFVRSSHSLWVRDHEDLVSEPKQSAETSRLERRIYLSAESEKTENHLMKIHLLVQIHRLKSLSIGQTISSSSLSETRDILHQFEIVLS